MKTANFPRKFSQKFVRIAAPLKSCRSRAGLIEWTTDRIQAFEQLKQLFASNLLLRHVNWHDTFYLTTDASITGVGAWIGQKDADGTIQPITCASKVLTPTQQKWSATKRKLWALMWGMEKFRHYLLGRWFIARVDHKPLVALVSNKMTTLTEGWIDSVMRYNFTTEYYPGGDNTMVDAFSRSHDCQPSLHTTVRTVRVTTLVPMTQWSGKPRNVEKPLHHLMSNNNSSNKLILSAISAQRHFSEKFGTRDIGGHTYVTIYDTMSEVALIASVMTS